MVFFDVKQSNRNCGLTATPRSGKTFSRTAHDLADGQIVGVDEPFMVNGVPLMYPRDPAGPPAETINCGCVQLPIMEDWQVKHSGRQPFSGEEQAKNPIKRDLARELNPLADTTSIASLDGLPVAEAKKRIAQDLAGEDFAAFINRVGGSPEQRPVAVLPPKIKEALGSASGIVRLSSYTVAKQRLHRRGQAFTAVDYQRVQDMLDKGLVLKESATHLQVFKEIEGKIWKAVVKQTKTGDEIYLQSLHRATALQLRGAKRKLKSTR